MQCIARAPFRGTHLAAASCLRGVPSRFVPAAAGLSSPRATGAALASASRSSSVRAGSSAGPSSTSVPDQSKSQQDMTSFDIICLGGGSSSGYLAKELQPHIREGQLCIITDEQDVAYERPTLSKGYFLKKARLPGFYTCVGIGQEPQDPLWYSSRGITYKTSSKVAAVDLPAKTLTIESGETLTYGKLVIATGARPTSLPDLGIPGEELRGVHYLRNHHDAASLYQGIEETKARGGKAVVLGSGYIGMEITSGMSACGLNPTMVFPTPCFMSNFFTPQIADFYEKFYADKGVSILKNTKVTSLEGMDGRVAHVVVETSTGETVKLPADLVVAGIGARANVELFAGQVEMQMGGIKVDEHLRTSAPDVYAIGDVASYPLKLSGGEVIRQEHIWNARHTATQAARELIGAGGDGYDYLPCLYSRVFSLGWQFYGLSSQEIVNFGNQAEGKFGAFFLTEGKVVGTFLESGKQEEHDLMMKIARAKPAAPEKDVLEKQGLSYFTSRL